MMPSLTQLSDAVQAFIEDNPDDLISVVVDATFGHRIDTAEVPEFEAAIEHNELVAPPAGAVGRGDAFVLAIANKVGATILSNDSFQEFHGVYDWLFDEGRLIGGKPVPHVGWVFVPRLPVRGPLSRKSVRDAGAKTSRTRGGATRSSKVASGPLPIPKTPPPGARLPGAAASVDTAPVDTATEPAVVAEVKRPKSSGRPGSSHSSVTVTQGRGPSADAGEPKSAPGDGSERQPSKPKSDPTNDLMAFLGFVEHHPIGSSVEAVVDSYSSHGAYLKIGDVVAYLPLRLMASPPPRSARDVVKLGDTVTLAISSYQAQRRSIELCMPELAPAAMVVEDDVTPPKSRRRASKVAVADVAVGAPGAPTGVAGDDGAGEAASVAAAVPAAKSKRPTRRRPTASDAAATITTTTTRAPQPDAEAPSPVVETAPAQDGATVSTARADGPVVVKPAQRGRGGRGRRPEVLAPAPSQAAAADAAAAVTPAPESTVAPSGSPRPKRARATASGRAGSAATDPILAAPSPLPANRPPMGTIRGDEPSAEAPTPPAAKVAKKRAASRRGAAVAESASAAASAPAEPQPSPAPAPAAKQGRRRPTAAATAAADTAARPPKAVAAPAAAEAPATVKPAKRAAKKAAPAAASVVIPPAGAAAPAVPPKRSRKKVSS